MTGVTGVTGVAARRWRVGVALLIVYAAVAIVTQGLSSRRARPLFDGFAPPTPYRWVKPPPEFTDNQPPESAERTIPLSDDGSEAANASTTDAQIIVTLPRGAVLAHPPDTALALKITPFDAPAVAPLPPDQRPVSNAYQVSMTYQPSQAPVPKVDSSTAIAMTAASDGDSLLYLPPGAQQWQTIASRAFGNTHGRTGSFPGPGHYVVVASPAVTTTTAPGGPAKSGSGGVVAVVGVVIAAAGVGGAVAVRSRRKAAAARTRQQRRRQDRSRPPRRRP